MLLFHSGDPSLKSITVAIIMLILTSSVSIKPSIQVCCMFCGIELKKSALFWPTREKFVTSPSSIVTKSPSPAKDATNDSLTISCKKSGAFSLSITRKMWALPAPSVIQDGSSNIS